MCNPFRRPRAQRVHSFGHPQALDLPIAISFLPAAQTRPGGCRSPGVEHVVADPQHNRTEFGPTLVLRRPMAHLIAGLGGTLAGAFRDAGTRRDDLGALVVFSCYAAGLP
ncbi:MAG: hypothetical protein RML36_04505 [Anaerolineae bacterium]|nr:hypothetical protein [Anaerolineae bacterium]MDW8098734.1 hypothetical protein [Anaerolineae bacterium]